MKKLLAFTLTAGLSLNLAAFELKDVYDWEDWGDKPMKLVKVTKFSDHDEKETPSTQDGFSITCHVGQAIPDKERGEKWYKNNPIYGLKFELRARLARTGAPNMSAGYGVFSRNGEVLRTFMDSHDRPLFWKKEKGHVQKFGAFSEWFDLDLLDGNGFFYNNVSAEAGPDYFLYNCKQITKKDLPVYMTAWVSQIK